MTSVCAWCEGTKAEHTPGVSHGICQKHMAEELSKAGIPDDNSHDWDGMACILMAWCFILVVIVGLYR